MPHQAYPITSFTEGLQLNREPFLSPRNGWRELKDGRIFNGRLEKRGGFSVFGALSSTTGSDTSTWPQIVGLGSLDQALYPGITYGIGYFGSTVPESLVFQYQDSNGTADPTTWIKAAFTKPVSYNLVVAGDVLSIYAIDHDTGDLTDTAIGFFDTSGSGAVVNWTLHPNYSLTPGGGLAGGEARYRAVVNDPVVYLTNYEDTTSEYLLALTRTSLYKWNAIDAFEAEAEGAFTTGDRNAYWSWPIETHLIITNGVDAVQRWSNSAGLEPMPATGLTATLDAAELVVKFRAYLIYFGTTEGGQKYPRRMRWSSATDETQFNDFDFADAPAEWGSIKTLGFVGERLMVGFERQWAEAFLTGSTADGNQIRWRPVESAWGAVAKNANTSAPARLYSRSNNGIELIDANGQRDADPEIPDLVRNISPALADVSHAIRSDDDRAFWWAYANGSGGSTSPDRVLAAQYDTDGNLAWSLYSMAFESFGKYKQSEAPTWDSLAGTWNDYSSVRWDDNVTSEEFPIVLGGRSDGVVAFFSPANSDFGSPIEMEALTQALSPLGSQKTHLGWVDVYAEAVWGQKMTLTFYDKVGGSGYKTVEVDLSPSPGSTSKVYRRVRVGRTALMHQIRVKASGNQKFALDALVPWFRPAGRAVEFG